MAYYNELSFASGYYHIDCKGVVTFADNTPDDIKRKFWEIWPEFRRTVIELEKKGIYKSRYPFLPIEDEEPNKDQYM